MAVFIGQLLFNFWLILKIKQRAASTVYSFQKNADFYDIIFDTLSLFFVYCEFFGLGGLWLMTLTRPIKALPKPPIQMIIIGILLFCGSLFLYLLAPLKIFMIITPIGGILLIIAFLILEISTKHQ